MNNIFVIKGQSSSGKSTRMFQLFKFFDNLGFTPKGFNFENKEGKTKQIGYIFEELNLLFIGKIYKSGGIDRWQGLDSMSSAFETSQNLSDFLKENSKKYSFIIEGSITRTNRLRPQFLHDYCGFENIFIQYYSFELNQKDEYLNRVILRSGKIPEKNTGWAVCKNYHQDYGKTQEEINQLDCNCFTSFELFDAPVDDLGCKILMFLGSTDLVEDFINFVAKFDYISKNKFKNFNNGE